MPALAQPARSAALELRERTPPGKSPTPDNELAASLNPPEEELSRVWPADRPPLRPALGVRKLVYSVTGARQGETDLLPELELLTGDALFGRLSSLSMLVLQRAAQGSRWARATMNLVIRHAPPLDQRYAPAVGWVTLGDAMGREVGEATFGPKLRELADLWGRDEFERVREAWYARLRRPTGD